MSATSPIPVLALLTTKQAAETLQISERHIFNLIRDKRLPVVKLGKSLRIHPEALAEFARTGTGTGTAVRIETSPEAEADPIPDAVGHIQNHIEKGHVYVDAEWTGVVWKLALIYTNLNNYLPQSRNLAMLNVASVAGLHLATLALKAKHLPRDERRHLTAFVLGIVDKIQETYDQMKADPNFVRLPFTGGGSGPLGIDKFRWASALNDLLGVKKTYARALAEGIVADLVEGEEEVA